MKKISLNLFVIIFTLLFISALAQEESDPILEFYSKRAKEVYQARQPDDNGLAYSYLVKTYYKPLDKGSNPLLIDSSITRYYYSFGQLDSTVRLNKPEHFSDKPDLSVTNIFSGDYNFYFYPNDTGGANLAIGFDSYDFDPTIPIGFAVIDRERYFLKWLYLYNVADRKDKRTSRWLRFVEHEGYIFPDSVWELKVNLGVFSTDYYRLETGISDIQIYR